MSLGFDGAGLHSLHVGATEFLERGSFQVNAVRFSSPSRVLQGSLQHTSHVDASRGRQDLTFNWGRIGLDYCVKGETLFLTVETTNRTPVPLTSISYDALILRLPVKPAEYDGVTPMLATNIGDPSILPLTFGAQSMVLCNEDVRKPLLVGFPWPLDKRANRTFPLRIITGREDMYPNSLPTIERPIAPGTTDRITLSLRFGPSTMSRERMAPDILEAFHKIYPFVLKWPDRRPIGSLIIGTAASKWPGNPRGWLLDRSIDTTTKVGIAAFQKRLLTWADQSIAILKEMNAQGMVTWDIEGEQFEHPTTYIGDPRVAEVLAPEMQGVIDEYFRRFTRVGLRVGVTIRPQTVVISNRGRRVQQKQSSNQAQVLIDKISYARKRWGATLFYVDSNGDPILPLSFEVMKQVADRFPDVLIMPEHKNLAYYSSTAPYTELRGGFAATPPLVRAVYHDAFSVINTADGRIDQDRNELRKSVAHGDILMFRAWFDDPANPKIKALYLNR